MDQFKEVFEDLLKAVLEKDTENVRKIHSNYPELLNYPNTSHMVKLLLFDIVNCDNEEITKLLVKLIKSGGTNNNLEQHIKIALNDENVPLVGLLLKNGAVFGKDGLKEDTFINKMYKKVLLKDSTADTFYKLLKLLIEFKQLNPFYENKEGENLIHLICYLHQEHYECVEFAEYLTKYGVPFDKVDSSGVTPLLISIERDNEDFVSFLIRKGADVNKETNTSLGLRPLIVATRKGSVKIADLLISNGADVNAKDRYGRTALHYACDYCWGDVIHLLIRRGADVNVKSDNGSTAFSLTIGRYRFYDSTVRQMVKEISRLYFGKFPITQTDYDSIQNNVNTQQYFVKCTEELTCMKNEIFFFPYSYYSVLVMSNNLKKLVNLTRNKDFVEKFKEKFSFVYYKDDLLEIFADAIQGRDKLVTVESKLKSVFDNSYPEVIIRKLTKYITVEDLPWE